MKYTQIILVISGVLALSICFQCSKKPSGEYAITIEKKDCHKREFCSFP